MRLPAPEDPYRYIQDWREQRNRRGWWHSFELPDGSLIEGVSDLGAQRRRLAQFPIPGNLAGKRVLDVGTWDGWFAFDLEKRGAEVTAIDRWENPRFLEMRCLLGSRADYRVLDVYDLDPARLGRFDIVLFLGVLYHLKHPLLALERVCSVSTDLVAVESFVLREHHLPGRGVENEDLLQFFESDELGGQVDNWFAPTPRCLMGLCRTAGFARAELLRVHEFGAAVACYRTWGDEAGVSPGGCLPKLLAAHHTENAGINFRSGADEYLACLFEFAGELARGEVQPEVGGFGVAPVHVAAQGPGRWLAYCKLPPGLAAGWHPVCVGVRGAGRSNPLRVAVDLEARAERLEITGVCDGITWETGQVSLGSGTMTLWLAGLPENADVANLRVRLGDRQVPTVYLGPCEAAGLRQANVALGERLEAGEYAVTAALGETVSPPARVQVVP